MVAALAALLAGAVPAQAARATAALTPTALLSQVNHVRAAHGLRPVELDGALGRAAHAHSSDMVFRGYFLHESGPGGEPFEARLGRFYHPPAQRAAVGEILAWGTGSYATPAGAVDGWLKSPPHRAVLLSARYTRIGIGLARGRFLGHTGAAVWTADFARP